jgi:hypothetical protein
MYLTTLVIRVCPGADNQSLLPTTTNSTQKSYTNIRIKYKITHTGPSSVAIVAMHHGQPGGIYLPAKVSILRPWSIVLG